MGAAAPERLKAVPMLILWGMKDFVFDYHFLEEWQRRFPAAGVHRFPHAGHYLFEDEPESIIAARAAVPCGPARHPGACGLSRDHLLTEPANIAAHLVAMAAHEPYTKAVIAPAGRDRSGRACYTHLTFRQLDRDSDAIAVGFYAAGIERGARAVLMVRPGLDFFSLIFAVFKAGIVPVVIDPGIGLRGLAHCCAQAAPDAFIGIPRAITAQRILGWGSRTVKNRVWVGAGRTFVPSEYPDARIPAFRGKSHAGTAAGCGAAGYAGVNR